MGALARKVVSYSLLRAFPGIFVVLELVSTSYAYAHPHYAPVNAVSPIGQSIGASYGGYGYVASSEAAAASIFEFSCSPEAVRGYVMDYCGPKTNPKTPLASFIHDTGEALLAKRLREHQNEYIALQLAAVHSNRGRPPSCLDGSADIKRIYQSLPRHLPADSEIEDAKGPRRALLAKFRAVGQQLTSGNMVRALIYYDQLVKQEKKKCGRDAGSSACVDIRNQGRRIVESFPVLFAAGPMGTEKIRKSLYEILGARLLNRPAKERQEHGRSIYSEGIEGLTDAPVLSLSELEKKIADGVFDAREQNPEELLGVNAALGAALKSLNASIDELRSSYLKAVCQKASAPELESFDDLLRQDTNVLRQALADMNKKELSLAQSTLCERKALQDFRKLRSCRGVSVSLENKRFSVDAKNYSFPYANDVNYVITRPDRSLETPIAVELVVNVVSSLKPEETAKFIEERNKQVSDWYNCQTGAVPSFKQVDGIDDIEKCPSGRGMSDPRLVFNIKFQSVPADSKAKPQVKLNQCFNADLPDDKQADCAAIRQYFVGQCLKEVGLARKLKRNVVNAQQGIDLDDYLDNLVLPSGPPKSEHLPALLLRESDDAEASEAEAGLSKVSVAEEAGYCEKKIAARDAASMNRVNSGSYTPSTKVSSILHEVGHCLGLEDEYIDASYPFLPLGEHDSLMNGSIQKNRLRLYPRHLSQILAPFDCANKVEAKSEAAQ